MNLGKLNEANDIATMNTSPSNEEPSVLTGSRREEMMQKLSQQEKEEINQLPKEDLHGLKFRSFDYTYIVWDCIIQIEYIFVTNLYETNLYEFYYKLV
jgi:hypothetical protein